MMMECVMEMEMANVKALKAGLIFISWVCLKIGQLFRVGYGKVMNSLRKSMNESGHTQCVCVCFSLLKIDPHGPSGTLSSQWLFFSFASLIGCPSLVYQ
jgi:hypothetical protein